MGVSAEGVHRAHPQHRAGGLQQGQQQGDSPGIAMLTEDAQSLHALLLCTLQEGEAEIAFGGHIHLGGFEGLDFIEGIAEQFSRQLPGQHLGIEGQLRRAVGEGFGEGQGRFGHGAVSVARS